MNPPDPPILPQPAGTGAAAPGPVELGRRLQLIARAAGIGWWSLEGRAERAMWSDELRELHGLAAGEAVPLWGDWLRCFVHADDVPDVIRIWGGWMKSEAITPLEHSFRLRGADGVWRDIIVHATVERQGPDPLRFGVLIDVSQQRSVERALRQAHERAALAARGAGIGTWQVDLESGAAHWDEPMWRLRGREPEPRVPGEEERLRWIHPADRERVGSALRAGQSQQQPLNIEFRVVWPDGQVRWLASRSAPLHDEHGRCVSRIGVNWDITAEREAEAARQERAIAQRESEAKSRFLSRMSHELRTPLNAVIGFAQLLLADEAGAGARPELRIERLNHLLSAGRHLLSLVDDVLDLTALEGGEVQVSLHPVELRTLWAETVPLIETLVRQHRVRLAVGRLDALVLADRTRLRQVLLNLLSNAVKYNHDGGWVEVNAVQRGGWVHVHVADSGRGMSDEQLAHLFEPFNRLGLEGQAIEGTGIGLTIVKALVERMGGRVVASSRPGAGSVFEVILPAAAAPFEPASPRPPVNLPAPRIRRGANGVSTILYIEDNAVNAMIVSQLVQRRADLRLVVAGSGHQGLHQAMVLQPSLVLLDMQLPDLDGHQVLQRLRADTRTAEIPCIALSANALPHDIDAALRAGLSDYWTKPLDFKAFMAALDRLFGPAPRG